MTVDGRRLTTDRQGLAVGTPATEAVRATVTKPGYAAADVTFR